MADYAAADGRWPDLAQVFRVERRRTTAAGTSVEVAYGITSLGPDRADAARLLKYQRGHWGIENGLFHVRDVSLGEDACRVRRGHAPEILGALRNVAVHLAKKAGRGVAYAARRWNLYPEEAIRLLRT